MASSIIEPERNRCSTPPSPPGEVSLPETGSILRDVHPETVDMTRPLCTIPIGRNDRRQILFSSSPLPSYLRPTHHFPSFFRREGVSLDPLQALESALASNSRLECLGERRSVYLLSSTGCRCVVRLVNSVSILDPSHAPRRHPPPSEEFPSRTVEPATAFSRDRKSLLLPPLPP